MTEKLVKIVYHGPLKQQIVPEITQPDGSALVINRDEPVDVPESFAKSRLEPTAKTYSVNEDGKTVVVKEEPAPKSKHWALVTTSASTAKKKGGDS